MVTGMEESGLMAVANKRLVLQKESILLLSSLACIFAILISVFLWIAYSMRAENIPPIAAGTALAVLDKNAKLLANTPSFKPELLSDTLFNKLKSIPSTEKPQLLGSTALNPGMEYFSYRLNPDQAYTVIMGYNKQAISARMEQIFLWGIGGFMIAASAVLVIFCAMMRHYIVTPVISLSQMAAGKKPLSLPVWRYTEFDQIFDRVAAKEDEKNSNQATEQEKADRAKAEFLACVSHELRTPLNAVIGYSEMLKEQMFGDIGHPKYKEYSENIYASGNHLLKMINDILDISHASTGTITLEKKLFLVKPLIEECIHALTAEATQNGVAIYVVEEPGIGIIEADAAKLRQAVTNILSNAIKFTPPGGNVYIHVNRRENDLSIQVEDTGIGMSGNELQKAMQGYFSQVDSGLDRKFEGMGLGLSFAKRLIELHHGVLIVESRKNKGTKVAISIPCLVQEAA